ncbi:hypothetical protein EV360DRAFT_90130 [Lentinula raphanica]|nr:hypothetical protein EV360DRAFT_90130 [Lentinula raphanica]
MEVLFCAMAFYNAFDEFESLFRLDQGLKKYLGSSHGEASEISNIRDQLRKTLYTIKAVQGQIDNFQTAFGWFLSLITGISGLPCNTKCISYFGTTTLELWKCTHAPSGMEHCRLKIQKRPVGWASVPHQWDEYQGSIQSWFTSISNFRAKLRGGSTESGCWRKEYSKDSTIQKICAGTSTRNEVILDIPVILVIQPDVSDGKLWDFPLKLRLGSEIEARKGLVFELVGRVFYGHNHYMANIAVPTSLRTKSVFTYDGMKYQGYSQRLEGNVDELIAGTSPSCPPGFHTHSVVYKLKGGLKAQQLFKNRQIANAMQTLQLQLDTSPGPILCSPHWVKTSAIDTHHHCSNSTVEYHLSKPGIPDTIMTPPTQPPYEIIHIQEEDIPLARTSSPMQVDRITTPLSSSPLSPIPTNSEPHLNNFLGPHLPSAEISSSPPPPSPLSICCRCGVEADGHREAVVQDTIHCSGCNSYTHIACLTMRLTAKPLPRDFFCHRCEGLLEYKNFVEFRRTLPQLRQQKIEHIQNRLFPGKGLLVQHQNGYYYPGRLIFWDAKSQNATVEMWRGIKNSWANQILRDLPGKRLVDGLWKDQDGRRKIRLGIYIRPLEEQFNKEQQKDNMLLDPNAIKCPKEISDILNPHRHLLCELAISHAQFTTKQIPCLSWDSGDFTPKVEASANRGGLLDTDLAAIHNWLYHKIPRANELEQLGMLHYSVAHARTLVVAHHHHTELLQKFSGDFEEQDPFVLSQAWERLMSWTGLTIDGQVKSESADVNFEAISLLDQIMFDQSKRAGIAGNEQWGLNSGPHKKLWNPYVCGPNVTRGSKRESNNDSETEPGPDYDHAEEDREQKKIVNHKKGLLQSSRPSPKKRKQVLKDEKGKNKKSRHI